MIGEKWLLKVICLQNLNDRLKETQKEVFNGKERERKKEKERERRPVLKIANSYVSKFLTKSD